MKKIAIAVIIFMLSTAVPAWASCCGGGHGGPGGPGGPSGSSRPRKPTRPPKERREAGRNRLRNMKKRRQKAEEIKKRNKSVGGMSVDAEPQESLVLGLNTDDDDEAFNEAFDGADPFSSAKRSEHRSDVDTVGTDITHQEDEGAVEDQLGGVEEGDGEFSDSDVLVKRKFREDSGESNTSSHQNVDSETEVKKLPPDAGFSVEPTGDDPVTASGVGDTRAEALNDALGRASDQVEIRVKGETVARESESTGQGSSSGEYDVSSRTDTSSEQAFSDYEVEDVTQHDDGHFEVTVEATPGVVRRR
ncbi:hypothetical protein OAA99_02185 [Omnitrophica bacterium]|nr:hypothetical protein [Candidatus Omnitrophota bacterium]